MLTLVVDIDSLRPDHVGAYGYSEPTTPNIDRLAEDAVRFDRAYAANSPCMPARAGFLSGRYGIANGVATHEARSQTLAGPATWEGFDGEDSNYWTLPETLFQDRTRACAVSSFPRHPAPWFYHLWDEFHQPREPAGEGEYFQTPRAETVADRAIDCLDRHTEEDLFLYAQFWDPHTPYNRSDEEIAQFDPPRPEYPTDEQIASQQADDHWRCASQQGIEDAADLLETLAHYDAEIHYCDRHVGRLLDVLRDRGRYEEALIVLLADHGEEFGEHGLYSEHWSTHEGTQRIPLLVKPPGGARQGTSDALVTNVDLAPTILNYAGLDRPAAWQGRSLRPLLTGESTRWRERVVLDHGLYTAQRAVRTDRWKFVRTYHDGVWDLPERQLFDLDADPHEQTDVADAHPDVVTELERAMACWAETHVGREEDALHAVAREGPAGLAWADEE